MTKTPNPFAYSITVREIAFDGETLFEARVKELPDAREYAETVKDAYDLAIDTIETAATMFAESGRPFPPPAKAQDDFSGRITLRLPKSLHQALVTTAEDEGVSLNLHLVTVLAHHVRVHDSEPKNAWIRAPEWRHTTRQGELRSVDRRQLGGQNAKIHVFPDAASA